MLAKNVTNGRNHWHYCGQWTMRKYSQMSDLAGTPFHYMCDQWMRVIPSNAPRDIGTSVRFHHAAQTGPQHSCELFDEQMCFIATLDSRPLPRTKTCQYCFLRVCLEMFGAMDSFACKVNQQSLTSMQALTASWSVCCWRCALQYKLA